MGAHDYTICYNESDQDKIRTLWDRQVEEDRMESGGGAYAGNATTLSGLINFHDRRLASEDEANEYVLDKHRKWSGPIACSFLIATEFSDRDRARIKKALDKVRGLESKQYNLALSIVKAFIARKSELVGCKGCGSRLAHDRLAGPLNRGSISDSYVILPSVPYCPLCKVSLLSKTDQKRMKLAADKVKTAWSEHKKTSKPKPSKKIGWCVGGWAAC
jgi:hypothetical protein